jgi:hypothetical protein
MKHCNLCQSKHERQSDSEYCLNYIEYSIGECYVSALENNDDSGLDTAGIELLKDFSESNLSSGQFLITDNDLGFTQCDVSGLWNNCIEYKLYKAPNN